MIRTVDRYIAKSAVLGILLVWVSLTALMMMFALLGELRDTTANYDTSDVLWFVLLTGPRLAYQIFPVSALMGSLLGIGALANANELVAFRISGVSRLRLAAAGMAGALMITIPVMAIGEWVAPDAEQQASQQIRQEPGLHHPGAEVSGALQGPVAVVEIEQLAVVTLAVSIVAHKGPSLERFPVPSRHRPRSTAC